METTLNHGATDCTKGEIVMYQPDETIKLEVRMDEDTVWQTQQQMAELFDKDITDIGRHIRSIYKEEELERNITCAKFAYMVMMVNCQVILDYCNMKEG